ncbi:MAG: class 1 fructose-bisphosphatase [Rhodomicrobiaceae bacterium]
MRDAVTLRSYLTDWCRDEAMKASAAAAIEAIAAAAAIIAARIAKGPLEGHLGAKLGGNADGDTQTKLDVWANDQIIAALRGAQVAVVASEELQAPLTIEAGAPIAVAIDPLDGSSNIDTNVSVGTIFALLPAKGEATFLQPGSAQIAAGYVIYGPQCAMVLTVGEGTQRFTLDPETRDFLLTGWNVTISPDTKEFAINASNYRHWSDNVRAYVDDCLAGVDGPRVIDFNMRWIASLVAECHRILARGGIFLYPRDARKGYQKGRLRLIYEASPIAFIVEQAGGKAFDGFTRILDIAPEKLHQRTPLIFGSANEIDRIACYKADPNNSFERSPLFGRRGLLRI